MVVSRIIHPFPRCPKSLKGKVGCPNCVFCRRRRTRTPQQLFCRVESKKSQFSEDDVTVQYHRMDFSNRTEIANGTLVILTPLKACHDFQTCQECLSSSVEMLCEWCETIGKCSSGFDRNRREWEREKCHVAPLNSKNMCPEVSP